MFPCIQRHMPAISPKRFLLIISLTALAATLLAAVLIAALPAFVSAPAVQGYARTLLSKTLRRQVTWSTLNLSWSSGLELRNLVLGSGPAPLLRLAMEEMSLVPRLGFRDGRLRMDISLRCRNISAESAPGPPKPPPPFKEPLTAIAEAVQSLDGMEWPLPLDLGVRWALDQVTVVHRDPKSGRAVVLRNLAVRCEMPSLADKPIVARLHGSLAVDGHRLEGLSLSVDLRRLVTASRRIHPASALVTLRAALPGGSLSIRGGLREPEGFAAQARLQLPRLMSAWGALLPGSVPALQGNLDLDLLARADGARDLHLAMELNGSRLAMGGGALGKGRIGPLELRLRQNIDTDRRQQRVCFRDGNARIDTLLAASWEASVDRPSSRDRQLTVRLGPVRVDLKRALELGGPLLPAQLPLRELTGELVLRRLSARLRGDKNRGEVSLEGLGVTMPRFRLALARGGVVADQLALVIQRATVPLEALQPVGGDASLSYGLRRCALDGAQLVVAEGVGGRVRLRLRDLDLKSGSPRRVAARVELDQTLELDRVSLERNLTLDGLRQQTTALILAKESGEVELGVPELMISVAGLRAVVAGKQLEPLPLKAVVTAAGIRLEGGRGAPPLVEHASCTLSGGDAFQFSARGALSGGSPRVAVSDGTLRVDLARMLPLAAPFLPRGAAAGGSGSLAWEFAAPAARQQLPATKNPLALARAALGMVRQGTLQLLLDGRGISWPLRGGELNIASLRTPQPLRVAVPADRGGITLDAAIAFDGLKGLSASSGTLPAQSGSLSLRGELAGWQSLRLREELRAQPFGLVQRGEATISRIDLLLEKQEPITAALLLQLLDAAATADLEARFPAAPAPLPGGIQLSGLGRARVGLTLAAGRDLQLRARAAARDLGVRLANGTTAEGVHADLLLDRSYALSREGEGGWSPLSASLVRPPPETSAAAGGTEIADRIREDLRGEESGSRGFTIRRLVVAHGETPLELRSLEGDLRLTPREMGLSFFQGEVLGGSVRLRSMIDLKPEIPGVSAACFFTNLETALLLPPALRRKNSGTRGDSEISGEVSVDAPLRSGQRELLEGVRMRLNLRKVGADTLERALFSLDPHERNEQLVAQRRVLRHGTLQALRVTALDGALGLDGEVTVRGVKISLPRVQRLRISELPVQKGMAEAPARISSLRRVLDLARADTLVVGPAGSFSLARRGDE